MRNTVLLQTLLKGSKVLGLDSNVGVLQAAEVLKLLLLQATKSDGDNGEHSSEEDRQEIARLSATALQVYTFLCYVVICMYC